MTVRTPLVPEPFVMSRSELYVLLRVSVHETVPDAGSIAIETMILFPAATPAAGTVIEVDVPVVLVDVVPMVFINEIFPAGCEMLNALLVSPVRPLEEAVRV